jgi:transketolase
VIAQPELFSLVELKDVCRRLRLKILESAVSAGAGHIAPAYSSLEIVASLYFGILRVDPKQPKSPDRDRFVMSKGHGCLALYAVLAERGFFPIELLNNFTKPGSFLGGHPDLKVPGVDTSTGSLGHGLPVAVGMSLAAKIDGYGYRTFALLSDGECQEGSVWEATMLASHLRLDNLTVIIDHNKLQSLGLVSDVMSSAIPFNDKWHAFGWAVIEIDGHNLSSLRDVLCNTPLQRGRPTLIVANTIKGKGISYMEQSPIWHYRIPNAEELAKARMELARELS